MTQLGRAGSKSDRVVVLVDFVVVAEQRMDQSRPVQSSPVQSSRFSSLTMTGRLVRADHSDIRPLKI